MSIASEPQTPWAHDRRNVSVPSVSPLTLMQQVEHAVHWPGLDAVALPVRLLVPLRVEALDAQLNQHSRSMVATQYVRGLGSNLVMVTGLYSRRGGPKSDL